MSIAKKVRKNNEHYMNNILGSEPRPSKEVRESQDLSLPKITDKKDYFENQKLDQLNLKVQKFS